MTLSSPRMDDEGCIQLSGMGPADTEEIEVEARAELRPRTGEMWRKYEVFRKSQWIYFDICHRVYKFVGKCFLI